jgi:DNA polymerase-1
VVGAVYGFFSMFLNILHEQKPAYIVVCFDRSKPTIRQSMFAGYHEHRPPMASNLTSQVATIDELLEKAGTMIASVDGYEGDDVIGTFAHQAVALDDDLEVTIVTGDRDLLQLVNGKVKVLMTITGLTKTMLFDEEAVEEKYGVKPSQFVDYKALIGDPSDGYPGITGIGPKTASSLIKEYGTFEELYKQLAFLPEKTALKLATDAEQGALAKKLATIITDAPVHLDLNKAKVADLKIDVLAGEFARHNFKSLIARLEKQYPQLTKKKAKKSSTSDGQMGLL